MAHIKVSLVRLFSALLSIDTKRLFKRLHLKYTISRRFSLKKGDGNATENSCG